VAHPPRPPRSTTGSDAGSGSSARDRPLLTLVRHAHAEWPGYSGRDYDRPLTSRGLNDALVTAREIKAAGQLPVLLLASPAARTRQTAEIIARELALAEACIQFSDAMYNASAATLEAALRSAAVTARHVLLVAHNPGISDLARRLRNDPALPALLPAQWLHTAIPAMRADR
jgi:phosphohistidine phosphatase